MTPLDLMKALRDVPEDLIDIYTDSEWENPVCEEPAERTVQPIIVQHLPKAHFREEQVQCKAEDPSRKRNGSAIMSYLMTAGCTAACIAGFALMVRLFTEPVYPEQEISIPSETQNAAVTEMTTARFDEAAVSTTAVKPSAIETSTQTGSTATVSAAHTTDTAVQTSAGTTAPPTISGDREQVLSAVAQEVQSSGADSADNAETSADTKVHERTTTAAITSQETVAVVTTEAPAVYELGDVNMDGEITEEDANLVLEDYLLCHSLGSGTHILTEEQLALADVTENQIIRDDGTVVKVTTIDAQHILRVARLRAMGYAEVNFDNLDDYIIYLNDLPDDEAELPIGDT